MTEENLQERIEKSPEIAKKKSGLNCFQLQSPIIRDIYLDINRRNKEMKRSEINDITTHLNYCPDCSNYYKKD